MIPTKEDVLKQIMKISMDFESEGVANVGYLAKRLGTTIYYVNKQVRLLLEEELVVRGIRSGGYNDLSYMPYPPVRGYKITNKAMELELYQTMKAEAERIFKECYGFSGEPY